MANSYFHLADTIADVTTAQLALRQTATAFAKLAQDFQPTANMTILGVRLRLNKIGTLTNGNVWVEFYAAGANPESGTLLGTSRLISAPSVVAGYTCFMFDTHIAAAISTQYYVVLKGDYAVSASNYLSWYRTSSSTYANGTAWTHDNTSWSSVAALLDVIETASTEKLPAKVRCSVA